MADIYLSSVDGDNADDGSTWALAKATLQAAMTAAGAGGTVYVDNAHAETQATTLTLSSPGTAASPVTVVCVDRTGDPEPPTARATTATVSVTGNSGIQFTAGFSYTYGITFAWTGGGGGGNNNIDVGTTSVPYGLVFEQCVLKLGNSGPSNLRIRLGPPASNNNDDIHLDFIDCSFLFSGTTHAIESRSGRARIRGCSFAPTGSVPTALIYTIGGADSDLMCVGSNLSTITTTLVSWGAACSTTISFLDCKLGTAVAMTTGTNGGPGGPRLVVINSDSADTNYRFSRNSYQAVETQETTIVRTTPAGASDGTTAFSRKVVTTANVTPTFPYESMWMEVWNETLTSQTVTVDTVTDNVTLTDAEAWLEIEYLGTSGFPLGLFTSDRIADPIFGTPANQATSTNTWTTTGLTTPVKQALAVTFTALEKGILRARVCVAKASTTVYYNPLMDLS